MLDGWTKKLYRKFQKLKISTLIKQSTFSRYLFIVLVILAGEAVFVLPFVLQRIFLPTFLETFELTKLERGVCLSIYGTVAFFSYFFGGILADKFKPNRLMAVALWLTAIGGFYMTTVPNYLMLKVLSGYWGFTTIFLFWAAMIKATRIWGGLDSQGKAFGFLDGGRGLVAALFGTLGVVIFSVLIPSGDVLASGAQSKEAFLHVIFVSSIIVFVVGILTLFFLKLPRTDDVQYQVKTISRANLKTVLKLPAVWLLMIIILCAYVGYKYTDIFSLYAREVMNYSEVDSAKTGTYLLFIRPIVGVLIGFLADRTRASYYLVAGFFVAIIGSLLFATDLIDLSMVVKEKSLRLAAAYALWVFALHLLPVEHVPELSGKRTQSRLQAPPKHLTRLVHRDCACPFRRLPSCQTPLQS